MRRGPSGRGTGGLLTILFTDIESSTAVTQRLGDAMAQEIVRAHNRIVRQEVAARGGSEVKHTGDGIMATFPSAARAVSCAVAIQRAAEAFSQEHPDTAFRVSVGLNAGEPVAEESDMFGAAVQLAARACAEAKGGQILTTDVVRQLVLGKGVSFADAGLAALKGFDQPVQLYEVSAAAAGIDESVARAMRFWRRPIVWAGAGVVAIAVVGGAVAAVFAVSAGGGGDDGSGPDYETYALRFTSEFPVEISAGDCETEDFVVKGQSIDGPVTGDLTGTVNVSFEARLAAEDGCRTLTAFEDAQYTVAGGGFRLRSISISRHRLGDSPLVGSTTDAVDAGIVTGGEGTFEGSVGKQRCSATGLTRTGGTGPTAVTEAECIMKLAASSRDLPLAIEVVVNTLEISTDRGSQDTPNAARFAAIFGNNTGGALRGVKLRLVEPAGARLATRETLRDDWTEGDRVFELPDLDPGEVGTFQFYVRVVDADGTMISLAPEISADGLDFVDRADSIALTVVR